MFNRNDIHAAVQAGIFSDEQATRFEAWLAERHADTVRFTPAHILYYFGGLVAIGAISLFVTLAWESWKGLPMCCWPADSPRWVCCWRTRRWRVACASRQESS